jgi:hypothetical protein
MVLSLSRVAALLAWLAAGTVLAQSSAQPAQPAPAPEARFSADVMYRILLGDIALQRGEPAVAARAYFEAAREAQEPVLARRATEIALFARQRGIALEAAQLWLQLDPGSDRARQMVTMLTQPGGTGDLKGDLGACWRMPRARARRWVRRSCN